MEQKTDELKTPPKIVGDRERIVESNKTKSIVQQEHQHQNQQVSTQTTSVFKLF